MNTDTVDESHVEPLNFKVEAINTISSSKTMPMEVEPTLASNGREVVSSNTITSNSSSITSTTKIYANLESAMPAGMSPQPPITIQTIEVIMKWEKLFIM